MAVTEQCVDVPTATGGDVRVSGPGIMDGYWNESALTRKTLQKGWIQTGDLARFDDDGYLWFTGRLAEFMVPAEVHVISDTRGLTVGRLG